MGVRREVMTHAEMLCYKVRAAGYRPRVLASACVRVPSRALDRKKPKQKMKPVPLRVYFADGSFFATEVTAYTMVLCARAVRTSCAESVLQVVHVVQETVERLNLQFAQPFSLCDVTDLGTRRARPRRCARHC